MGTEKDARRPETILQDLWKSERDMSLCIRNQALAGGINARKLAGEIGKATHDQELL